MCNLYQTRASHDEVAAHFRFNEEWSRPIAVVKDYVAPGKPGHVVREDAGERVLDTMLWGFPRDGKPVTNVRNYKSSFWRSALAEPSRRCLVPVTAFQEWSQQPDPETRKKRPYWFSIRARPVFAFAGIWRPAEDAPFFSFLTTGYSGSEDPEEEKAAAAAHVVGAIHPKAIPVILHEEDFDRWLRADLDEALSLATAFPSQLIEVSTS